MTSGSPPTVSVIVPTFRRPAALAVCLGALARLDYPADRFEVVVVDDGGGGVTRALAEQWAPGLRVSIVRQENQGPAAARNAGVAIAAGELLAFTDDDCRPRPSWLARLTAVVVAEPEALAGGRVENGLPADLFAQASQDLVAFLYSYFPHGRALLPFFTTNNVACSRSQFLAIGGFETTFRLSGGEDRDFSERWALEAGPLRYAEDAVVDHFHRLSWSRFLRQHHVYGRGGAHLARRRRLRGMASPMPEPLRFYAQMLGYPLSRHGALRGASIAGLIGLAQVAGLTGMLVETLAPSGGSSEG